MTPPIWLKVDGSPMSAESQRLLKAAMHESMAAGEKYRQWAEQWGCCPEQARLFLPYAVIMEEMPPESAIGL